MFYMSSSEFKKDSPSADNKESKNGQELSLEGLQKMLTVAANNASDDSSNIDAKNDEEIAKGNNHFVGIYVDRDEEGNRPIEIYLCANDPNFFTVLETFSSLSALTVPEKDAVLNDQEKNGIGDSITIRKLSTSALLQYIEKEASLKIPYLSEIQAKDVWRTEPILRNNNNLLLVKSYHYKNENNHNPNELVTQGYLQCTANAAVTEQLINYYNFEQNNPIQIGAVGARGEAFSFQNVPFHPYDDGTYNDLFCTYSGLTSGYTLSGAEFGDLKIHKDCSSLKDLKFIENLKGGAYSKFPKIAYLQNAHDSAFCNAAAIPVNVYIENSLEYQLSLPEEKRIKRVDKSLATDQEIKDALGALKKLIATEAAELKQAGQTMPGQADARVSEIEGDLLTAKKPAAMYPVNLPPIAT